MRSFKFLALSVAVVVVGAQAFPVLAQPSGYPANGYPEGGIIHLSPLPGDVSFANPAMTPAPFVAQPAPPLPPMPVRRNATPPPAVNMLTTVTPSDENLQTTNTAIKVGAASKKVPVGTFMTVNFNTPMDARITNLGEPFTATIAEDFKTTEGGLSRIILPAGTVVRGRVEDVKRPTFFSKGGAIFLTFDHVVLPSGDLLPLDLKLSTNNTKVNKRGALYADPGIPSKLQKSVNKGVSTFQKITQSGFDVGKSTADGLGSIVTVPLAVIGGTLAGTAVTAGKSAVAVVGKGDTVVIAPGDSAVIDFGGSFNLPSE